MKFVSSVITDAGTVLWNGPVGVFEFDQFGEGTKTVSMAIANSAGFSLAGGGDTIAAIQKYDIYDKVSYISTGAGAFLEFLEGATLPGVAALEARGWGLDRIWITHHHDDHTCAIPELKKRYGATVVANRADAARIPQVDVMVEDGGTYDFAGHVARLHGGVLTG